MEYIWPLNSKLDVVKSLHKERACFSRENLLCDVSAYGICFYTHLT